MRLNKKILANNITLIFLLIFSFSINQYYGYKGLTPLDDFLNFNCGYRILTGDLPFKDYYSVTGPALCIIQNFFYKIFGVNWFSLVIHASVFNVILCGIFYFFLKKIKIPDYLIILLCLGISILGYPNNGVPGVDHHAWVLSLSSLLFFYLGLIKKDKIIFILSPIFLFLSFLVKQVPSAYFLILIVFLYFNYGIKDKKFYSLKALIIISASSIFFLSFLLKIYDISLNKFIEQYIYLSLNLGSNRFEIINLSFFKENLSNIYFLFFLIIPLLINYYYFSKKLKNNIDNKIIKLDFFISLFLIVICYVYELHTNNSAMSFIALPIVVLFIYKIQHRIKNIYFLNYIYSLLIFYSWFRLAQNNFYFALVELIIFLIVIVFISSKRKFFFNTQSLLIIYFIFSTAYYFQTSVDSRKYKDISNDNKYLSFNGAEISKKFKNLDWNTSYKTNKENEIKNFIFKINLLKKLDEKFIFITDYQIYNNILSFKDYSPVKYWHTGVSYPNKKSKYRLNFEIFFKNKIIKNDIQYLIIDDRASVFEETIEDYDFLYKCSSKINNLNNITILVYQIDSFCLKNYKL
tara:strand:- start:41 stop:1768 length:1728 start_codon:yes stop_codon:yes gene_type:complete